MRNSPFIFLMFSLLRLASDNTIKLAFEKSKECLIIGNPENDDCRFELALFHFAILWKSFFLFWLNPVAILDFHKFILFPSWYMRVFFSYGWVLYDF